MIFAVLLSILYGYTMVIQGTTLALGRLLVGPASIRGTGMQDAITPKMQNIRNVGAMILFIPLFFLTTYVYAWYHALWVIILTFLASTAFPIMIGMKAGSNRIVSIILKDMEGRRRTYLKSGDELQSNTINDLIKRIEEIPQEIILKEVKR